MSSRWQQPWETAQQDAASSGHQLVSSLEKQHYLLPHAMQQSIHLLQQPQQCALTEMAVACAPGLSIEPGYGAFHRHPVQDQVPFHATQQRCQPMQWRSMLKDPQPATATSGQMPHAGPPIRPKPRAAELSAHSAAHAEAEHKHIEPGIYPSPAHQGFADVGALAALGPASQHVAAEHYQQQLLQQLQQQHLPVRHTDSASDRHGTAPFLVEDSSSSGRDPLTYGPMQGAIFDQHPQRPRYEQQRTQLQQQGNTARILQSYASSATPFLLQATSRLPPSAASVQERYPELTAFERMEILSYPRVWFAGRPDTRKIGGECTLCEDVREVG
jgi:hypothetical protein